MSNLSFQENYEKMQNLVSDLRGMVSKIIKGGADKDIERHVSRGKMLPRERINRLLDPGSVHLTSLRSRLCYNSVYVYCTF